MKRLRRSVFSFVAAMSLILCVATIVLWARSYWGTYEIRRESGGVTKYSDFFINSWEGRIFMYSETTPGTSDSSRYNVRWQFQSWSGDEPLGPPPAQTFFGRLGFVGEHFGNYGDSKWMIGCPHWAMALVLGLPILIMASPWYRGRVTRRRRSAGLCPTCGYDLRATPERCPECGTIPSKMETTSK